MLNGIRWIYVIPETLIFAIAFPRYPNVLVNKLKELKRDGFSIAAITDSMISIAYMADPIVNVLITIFDIWYL